MRSVEGGGEELARPGVGQVPPLCTARGGPSALAASWAARRAVGQVTCGSRACSSPLPSRLQPPSLAAAQSLMQTWRMSAVFRPRSILPESITLPRPAAKNCTAGRRRRRAAPHAGAASRDKAARRALSAHAELAGAGWPRWPRGSHTLDRDRRRGGRAAAAHRSALPARLSRTSPRRRRARGTSTAQAQRGGPGRGRTPSRARKALTAPRIRSAHAQALSARPPCRTDDDGKRGAETARRTRVRPSLSRRRECIASCRLCLLERATKEKLKGRRGAGDSAKCGAAGSKSQRCAGGVHAPAAAAAQAEAAAAPAPPTSRACTRAVPRCCRPARESTAAPPRTAVRVPARNRSDARLRPWPPPVPPS